VRAVDENEVRGILSKVKCRRIAVELADLVSGIGVKKRAPDEVSTNARSARSIRDPWTAFCGRSSV
jgi:hypothetical protein